MNSVKLMSKATRSEESIEKDYLIVLELFSKDPSVLKTLVTEAAMLADEVDFLKNLVLRYETQVFHLIKPVGPEQ